MVKVLISASCSNLDGNNILKTTVLACQDSYKFGLMPFIYLRYSASSLSVLTFTISVCLWVNISVWFNFSFEIGFFFCLSLYQVFMFVVFSLWSVRFFVYYLSFYVCLYMCVCVCLYFSCVYVCISLVCMFLISLSLSLCLSVSMFFIFVFLSGLLTICDLLLPLCHQTLSFPSKRKHPCCCWWEHPLGTFNKFKFYCKNLFICCFFNVFLHLFNCN